MSSFSKRGKYKFHKFGVDTIIVCCIFHNICIINDDIWDQYIVDGRQEENNPLAGVHELYGENDEDETGLEKQLHIANTFH